MGSKLIAGNWKMNHNPKESLDLLMGIKNSEIVRETSQDIILFPPSIYLFPFAKEIKNEDKLHLGIQNIHFEDNGAYTGEISSTMVKEICRYALVGHSERRQYFNETNQDCNKKIQTLNNHNIKAIYCVGENLKERENNDTFSVIEKQLKEGLSNLSMDPGTNNIIIAYEPVWAIGTGLSATTEQISEVHNFIKDKVQQSHNGSVLVLYGGSCKPSNSSEILSTENVDGTLIGGASLKKEDFCQIIENADKLVST